ncbi:hypothetical protein Acr_00g0024840 [Actinidia rufa]|uniref:Uncharacterized protein n=1 Tax=Actinidia rufa TaxID=165716 RepID=A0A7J0DD84_9ERIC|nr:hypothetical protein Acr_00g0024840 [Actinidia rufa]
MGKKRTRHQNPEPFLASQTASSASKNRSKPPKHHQQEDKAHQYEFEDIERSYDSAKDEEDIDEFGGFSETQSQFGGSEEIDEEDEKLLKAFLSKDAGPQRN